MLRRISIMVLVAIILVTVGLSGCSKKDQSTSGDEDIKVVDSNENNTGDEPAKEEETNSEDNQQQEEQNNEDNQVDETKKNENIVYISASKLNVRSEASKEGKKIGAVIKGAAVEILDRQSNEAGEVEWLKIEFDNAEGNNEGWISAKYTVTDRMDLLGEGYKDLDLTAQEKIEYPENPRVEVKGVYVTVHSAAGKRLDNLIELAKNTNINAFVIDVKDDNGNMLFKTDAAEKYSPEANRKAPIKDIEAFMKKLKDNNIYAIARIVSFKDPKYAKAHPDKAIVYKNNGKPYANRDGLIWVSAHDRQLWEYNIEVSKEAAKVGFNEIQFDYVRFPASNGGKLDKFLDYRNELGESKPVAVQRYLKYARENLSPLKVYISADIYGLVGSVADDMGIGQYWEGVSNIVDYVSPMMYPSHYGNGVYGLSVPDAFPYETINIGTRDAVARNNTLETPAIIRPWIQDFTATWVKGYIRYGDKEVRAQIKALEDNGVKEYLLWNAGNKYSEGGLK
ncbi:putative glycoside hydrolase [Wukongibacter baidiensis]|uniref:putative glycoside hydrolase n=1 Tax=Wukongibacter baidiensis TaxID=1723361 RepID=UPI003D7F2309